MLCIKAILLRIFYTAKQFLKLDHPLRSPDLVLRKLRSLKVEVADFQVPF